MKTGKFELIFVLAFCIGLFSSTYAQETLKNATEENKIENSKKASKPVQFTFFYPISTNGANSFRYSNDISLNLLWGVNGGVNAMEVGALANFNKGDVNGFQGAGFTNINIGKTNGVQAAGFYNQSKEFNGGQFAGFLNLNTDNTIGFMGAGFINIVRGNMKGWQGSGFVNITSKSITGAQISGFGNFSKDSVDGAQVAGFMNVAKDLDGAQVSGFVNVAKKVKGAQIGFLNIADSIDGVPIGFLSVVKHGYYRFELGASESLYANASFKIGVPHFYNIFTVGYKQTDDDTYWSYGYGIGSVFALGSRMNINIDATSQQVNENEWDTDRVNLLNTLILNISYKFTKRLEIVAGPSYNVMVSEFDFREGIGSESTFAPYYFYDKNHNDVNVKMFVGFNAAIRF